MKALSKIASSKIRSQIFRMLFGLHDEELHTREIERRSGFSIGSIQEELKKFRILDLIRIRGDGNRLYCIANRENPLFWDIHNIVMKIAGLEKILKDALARRADIHAAFVFGPAARFCERSLCDVDIMIIGDSGLDVVKRLLSKPSRRIDRKLKPHVIGPGEFVERRERGDPFITRVIKEPKLFIVGSERELASMGSE